MPTKTKAKSKEVYLIVDQDGDTRRFNTPKNKVGPTKEFTTEAEALKVAKANVNKAQVDFLYVVKASRRISVNTASAPVKITAL